MDKLNNSAPDGLCGDEDNGQTSAWSVFSAHGFYLVCNGSNQYVIGSPLFKKAILKFENGKTLEINAHKNNKDNIYISNYIFNRKKYTKGYLNHKDLISGGRIDIQMSETPNMERGINTADFPYSMSSGDK